MSRILSSLAGIAVLAFFTWLVWGMVTSHSQQTCFNTGMGPVCCHRGSEGNCP